MTAHPPPAPARLPTAGSFCLTFDDGPDACWTPRILDLLAQTGVRATFFVVGRLAREHAALVRRIAADGHALGNHTWSHRHPWTLSERAARGEVRGGAAVIADLLGGPAAFFRPPHGHVRRCMTEEAADCGEQLVLWSLSAVDWGPLGNVRRIARRLERARPGDVVLMHDGGWGINRPGELVRALPALLARLDRRDSVAETRS